MIVLSKNIPKELQEFVSKEGYLNEKNADIRDSYVLDLPPHTQDSSHHDDRLGDP